MGQAVFFEPCTRKPRGRLTDADHGLLTFGCRREKQEAELNLLRKQQEDAEIRAAEKDGGDNVLNAPAP
jgi:hypothetical protein